MLTADDWWNVKNRLIPRQTGVERAGKIAFAKVDAIEVPPNIDELQRQCVSCAKMPRLD
jgi:hypothetical protein